MGGRSDHFSCATRRYSAARQIRQPRSVGTSITHRTCWRRPSSVASRPLPQQARREKTFHRIVQRFVYNPPKKPPRPFEADYPNGAPVNAEGRLTHDVEVRPLTGTWVVGRQVVGGDDRPFGPEELNALAEAGTGKSPSATPPRDLRGAYGRVVIHGRSGRPVQVDISTALAPPKAIKVLGSRLTPIPNGRRSFSSTRRRPFRFRHGKTIPSAAGSSIVSQGL